MLLQVASLSIVDDVVAVVEAVAVNVVGDVSIFLIIYHRADMSEYE